MIIQTCIRGGGSDVTGGGWSPTTDGVGIICVTCTTWGSPRPLGGTEMGVEDGICRGPGPIDTGRGTEDGIPGGITLPKWRKGINKMQHFRIKMNVSVRLS